MKFSFSSVLTFALAAVPAVLAATLQEITSFGPNPTNTKMYVYVPEIIEGKTAGRPLVVELHYCTGNANSMFSGSYGSSTFRTLAEEYGWVVLYPESPDPGGCWDVHTSGTLVNNGGGDSLGVASQIQYVINNYGVDPTKIFATGLSSGASMAINLAATYPNLIAGSSAFAGVPFGCFAGPNIWNNACADGLVVKVAAEWGNMVRNAYPGFTGVRPKIQIWHGTQDEIFDPVLINEHIKQWTNVFGVGTSPTSTVDGFPNAKWTRRLYGSRFQMFTSNSQHIFEIHAYTAAQFFNILTPPPNPNPTTSPTPVPPTGFQEPWGQCGGMGYTGPTVCVSGYTCVFEDPYYSQCR